MRARILIAVSAWLLGAVTATGGCLMAVSLLGAGFGVTGNSSQQLNNAAVLKGLAVTRPEPSPAPSAAPSHAARARLVRRHSHAALPTPSRSATPSPTPTPAQSSAGAGTPLTSQAGTVVATCQSAGAYLLSWSPAQGYGVAQFVRGPAAVASVVFDAGSGTVTMDVSCSGGTPVSSTSSSPPHDE